MKKQLVTAVVAASLGLMASIASAAPATSATQSFSVTASLAAQCRTQSGQSPVVAFGTYEAFGLAVTATSANIVFECTRNHAPSAVAITAGSGGSTGSLKGVDFTLAVDAGTRAAGVAPAPDTWTYVVSGSMAAGQAGDTTGAGSTTRVLQIDF